MTLKPFEERVKAGLKTDAILNDLRAQMQALREAFVLVIPPPSVPGIGTGGGFKLYVQDRAGRGPRALEQAVGGILGPANQTPGLVQVFTLFNTSTPQVYADIDRTKAEMLGVPITRFFDTLSTYMGSTYINDFNILGQTYRVTAQADNPFRLSVRDVQNLRTRSTAGDMVPLGAVASFHEITGPYRVPRYNLFPAAEVQGATRPGFSTGQAIGAMERILANLPAGFGFEWTEIALQEKAAGSTAAVAFSLAVVFVFLLLAAQYESILLPLAVILIVPMCLLAAISGVLFRGMDNNILTQIGFVVLIGLAAKNAILIVEFAKQAEEQGMNRQDAVVQAARTRLRPILMTSFAFILGVVPLVIATGAGAEMRQALGTAVFFGMLGVTVFGLLFTPVFYLLVRWHRNAQAGNAGRVLARPVPAGRRRFPVLTVDAVAETPGLSHFHQLDRLAARALDHHGARVAQPVGFLQDGHALAPELGDPGIEVADAEPDVIVDVAARADERLAALPRIPGEQHVAELDRRARRAKLPLDLQRRPGGIGPARHLAVGFRHRRGLARGPAPPAR